MTPLGCEGGVQNTTAVVSDVPATATISTTPGATYETIALYYEVYAYISILPVSLDLPSTASLGSLVPPPLVAVMVTVII